MATKIQVNELVRRFKDVRRAHTPLVSVATPDQFATVALIAGSINGGAPQIIWDIGRGFSPVREKDAQGVESVDSKLIAELTGGKLINDPRQAIQMMSRVPECTVVYIMNAHRFLGDVAVMQLTANLRDQFKGNQRVLVLLGPQVKLPDELANDVVELDEPYPDDDELRAICQRTYDGFVNCPWKFPKADKAKAAKSLKGCSAFGAEQHFAMAAKGSGIMWGDLNASVQKTIEQTDGLTYEHGTETFDDIGGLLNLKRFSNRLFKGPESPSLVVRVEELEKATGGAAGDLSGTSQDSMQVMLSSMEDYGWSGLIAFGGPGTGKSMACKAMANSHNTRGLVFDVNACKGSLVGESERKVREAVKVIRSIGGDDVLFVASCNDASTINTALKRRYFRGTWFFDVPSDEDAAAIWAIQMAKFGISEPDATVHERDLTGADIRNICRQAFSLQCSLEEAREYVVPLKISEPQTISAAREQANGRYLDASRPGVYQIDRMPRSGNARRVEITGEDE